MARILSERADIRAWATARGGNPMSMETPDGSGSRTILQLTFGQHALNADRNEGPDPAVPTLRMVDWESWLAELESQNLALKVNDDVPGRLDNDFEFVARDGRGATTDAARQPPAATVSRPGAPED